MTTLLPGETEKNGIINVNDPSQYNAYGRINPAGGSARIGNPAFQLSLPTKDQFGNDTQRNYTGYANPNGQFGAGETDTIRQLLKDHPEYMKYLQISSGQQFLNPDGSINPNNAESRKSIMDSFLGGGQQATYNLPTSTGQYAGQDPNFKPAQGASPTAGQMGAINPNSEPGYTLNANGQFIKNPGENVSSTYNINDPKYANPNFQNQTSTIPQPTNTNAPTATTAPNTSTATASPSALEGQYASALANTGGVDSAQSAIDTQNNALRTGIHNVEDQPIGMSFISGQSASLEKRNTDLQIPLQQRLANEQMKRQASLDSIKFSLEREDKAKQSAYKKTKDTADQAYKDRVLAETIRNNTLDSVKSNTPSTTETKAQIEVNKKNDIASAILNFRNIMKQNNWLGINPEQYAGLVSIIKSKYGANAVLELEKAIADAGLSVDNG